MLQFVEQIGSPLMAATAYAISRREYPRVRPADWEMAHDWSWRYLYRATANDVNR